MISNRGIAVAIGALALTLLTALAPAASPPAGGAATEAPPWKHDNPFCQVIAIMAATSDGSGYGLAIYAAKGAAVDAHVTLISDTDAYDAHVASAVLSGPPEDRTSGTMLVKLPAPGAIKYYYVDSYTIDGGDVQSCPSYPNKLGEPIPAAPEGVPALAAQHLQSLDVSKCKELYRMPGLGGQLTSIVGSYGNKQLTVETRVYIDSNGRAVRESIVQSSGVEGVDQFAIGAIQEHRFSAAELLCTPVVSEMLIDLKYDP